MKIGKGVNTFFKDTEIKSAYSGYRNIIELGSALKSSGFSN